MRVYALGNKPKDSTAACKSSNYRALASASRGSRGVPGGGPERGGDPERHVVWWQSDPGSRASQKEGEPAKTASPKSPEFLRVGESSKLPMNLIAESSSEASK